MSATAGIKF